MCAHTAARRHLLCGPGRDLQQLVDGVYLVRDLGQRMLAGLGGGREHHPGDAAVSVDDVREYVLKHVGTMYHPACSCRVGRDDDPMAVLDAQMCVRGLSGLRVADASAMPEIVGANTNATCVALGEKAADLIASDFDRNVCRRPSSTAAEP